MATKNEKNIYEKIMEARLRFLESNPKKSGENKFQNFRYYELDDIVPTATRICNDLKLYTEIDMGANLFGYATLTVVNIDNVDERCFFRIKMPEITGGNLNNMLQDTGRTETYLRRYLYLLFLDIAQNDEVDAGNNSANDSRKPAPSQKKPVSKPRNKPALAMNKRLTMKQKLEIRELDPILEKIVNEGPSDLTMKGITEELQSLEDKGNLSNKERLAIAKKIATIE